MYGPRPTTGGAQLSRRSSDFLEMRRISARQCVFPRVRLFSTSGNLFCQYGVLVCRVDRDAVIFIVPGALDSFRSSEGALPSESNITSVLEAKVGRDLHLQRGHPLNTIKGIIEGHFDKSYGGIFHFADDRSPVVTTQMNFDDLLIPKDHVSRSPNDTYYIDQTHLLRTHTRYYPS